MSTYRIATVAEILGVPTSTLRYYEDIGLVSRPGRGSNGYRAYDDADVARLKFVTNTKSLGIPLDDVRELVDAYETQECSTVAHHVVELVAARLTETRVRITELGVLAEQLADVAKRLGASPASGACGTGCPCATVASEKPVTDRRVLVPLTRRPRQATKAQEATDDVAPVACSLDKAALPGRMDEWRSLLTLATGRRNIVGGVVVTFPADAPLAARVAALAAAEQECCPFIQFTLQFTTGMLQLEVRAPADAVPLVTALFAAAS